MAKKKTQFERGRARTRVLPVPRSPKDFLDPVRGI